MLSLARTGPSEYGMEPVNPFHEKDLAEYCHWEGPMVLPWSENATPKEKINALIWEAKCSLYKLHRAIADELYGRRTWVSFGGWDPMAREMESTFDLAGGRDGKRIFGHTFEWAREAWQHHVHFPGYHTAEEAERWNREHPNPCAKCVREGTEATCQQIVLTEGGRYLTSREEFGVADALPQLWVERYVQIVWMVLNEFPAPERPARLGDLIARLQGFVVGSAEGTEVTAKLNKEVKGREVLRLRDETHMLLLEHLGRVQDDLRTSELAETNGAALNHGVVASRSWTGEVTFCSMFGDENWKKVRAVMDDLGYRITKAKGKGNIIAALDAAFEHFEIKAPGVKEWPALLNQAFPGIEAGTKAAPPLTASQRLKSYREARAAVMDRLRG